MNHIPFQYQCACPICDTRGGRQRALVVQHVVQVAPAPRMIQSTTACRRMGDKWQLVCNRIFLYRQADRQQVAQRNRFQSLLTWSPRQWEPSWRNRSSATWQLSAGICWLKSLSHLPAQTCGRDSTKFKRAVTSLTGPSTLIIGLCTSAASSCLLSLSTIFLLSSIVRKKKIIPKCLFSHPVLGTHPSRLLPHTEAFHLFPISASQRHSVQLALGVPSLWSTEQRHSSWYAAHASLTTCL